MHTEQCSWVGDSSDEGSGREEDSGGDSSGEKLCFCLTERGVHGSTGNRCRNKCELGDVGSVSCK